MNKIRLVENMYDSAKKKTAYIMTEKDYKLA